MATKIIVFVTIYSVLLKQSFANDITTGNNDLRCYFCEHQMTNACGDEPDITALASIECKSFNYTPPTRGDSRAVAQQVLSNVVDGKFKGAPLLRDIFQKGGIERTEKPFHFVCLRISLSAGDKQGTIRACVRQESTIDDVCDFIEQKMDPAFKVNNCYSCTTDNCNSGSVLKTSIFILVGGLYLSYFKTKYFI